MILLVEDDPDMRENLALLLESQGFHVETASNGKVALEKLGGQPPCMIILDLMMPVMDGWQFRAKLQALEDLPEIPVVLLSGMADLQAEVRSLDAVDYLTKPVDLDKLYGLAQSFC